MFYFYILNKKLNYNVMAIKFYITYLYNFINQIYLLIYFYAIYFLV